MKCKQSREKKKMRDNEWGITRLNFSRHLQLAILF